MDYERFYKSFARAIRPEQYLSMYELCDSMWVDNLRDQIAESMGESSDSSWSLMGNEEAVWSLAICSPWSLRSQQQKAQANIAGCWLFSFLQEGPRCVWPCRYLPLALGEQGVEFMERHVPDEDWDEFVHAIDEFAIEFAIYGEQHDALRFLNLAKLYDRRGTVTREGDGSLKSEESERWAEILGRSRGAMP